MDDFIADLNTYCELKNLMDNIFGSVDIFSSSVPCSPYSDIPYYYPTEMKKISHHFSWTNAHLC